MKKNITIEIINEAFSTIQNELNIFTSSDVEISTAFLKKIIPEIFDYQTFNEKRIFFIKKIKWNNDEIPSNEIDFHKFICTKILRFKSLPREEFINIFNECQSDLEEINQVKSKYEADLKELNKNKEIEGKKYKKDLLIYYINKLEQAESGITSYIRKGLMETSFNNSVGQKKSIWSLVDYRYEYRNSRIFYAVENLNEISNKIQFVNLPRFFELLQIYKKDSKKFYSILKRNHPAKEFIQKIKKRINQNHILNKRKSILTELLKSYENRKYELFLNICPQQIEGLLYDLAIEAGIKPESLKTSSVSDKAQLLKDKTEFFHDINYEYYRFVFPVIRNRIAHGLGISENLPDNSYSLLLDLNQITKLICSQKLKTNKARILLEKAVEKKDLHSLIFYAEFLDIEIDNFYPIAKDKEEIRKLIIKEFKLKNLKPIIHANNIMYIMVETAANKLRGMKINKKECTLIINEIEKRKTAENNAYNGK